MLRVAAEVQGPSNTVEILQRKRGPRVDRLCCEGAADVPKRDSPLSHRQRPREALRVKAASY